MPEDLLREVSIRMPRTLVWTSYGSTEATGPVAVFGGREFLGNPLSSGPPLPTIRLRIVRDDGSDAAIGEPGEVCVSGANIFSGYVDDIAATAAAIDGGWLRMGDIGHMDSAGRLTIVDRRKNMIISGDENIYCAEVERVLSNHVSVREAIAYGIADARLGERLAACIVLKPDFAPTVAMLQDHVRSQLAGYKVPRYPVHRSALAAHAAGKDRSQPFSAPSR